MKLKKLALLAAALFVLIGQAIPFAASYSDLPEVDIQARSAILVHARTGEILFSHNIHIRREPASITKIMTVLLGIEYGVENECLDELVTVTQDDFFDIVEGSSAVNPPILAGEEITLRGLLYCAMVSSDNSACNMIARRVSGSVPAFMEAMNARLAEWGCENTLYSNTHGLPDPENHYTTAYDIYLMARECAKNALFMEMAHTEIWELPPTNKRPEGRRLVTTNNLITRRRFPDYIYPPARGIKTGSTNAAGHCLVSAAEKDGLTFISVVLGAAKDEETGLIRSFTETRDLFEWGFSNFTMKTILSKKNPVTSVKVLQGLDQDDVNLVPEQAVEALVPKGLNPEDVERKVTVFSPEGVQAPVAAGDVLGEITLSYQGHDYAAVPLVALRDVEKDNLQGIQDDVGNVIENIIEPGGSLRWIMWAVIGVAAVIALYICIIIVINVRRRRNRAKSYNYRGKKRY